MNNCSPQNTSTNRSKRRHKWSNKPIREENNSLGKTIVDRIQTLSIFLFILGGLWITGDFTEIIASPPTFISVAFFMSGAALFAIAYVKISIWLRDLISSTIDRR